MKLEDSRRLTGPNLYAARPGAVAQVTLGSNDDATGIVTRWRAAAVEAAEVLGWGSPGLHVRHFEGPEGIRGVALMIEAGLDQLFTATEVNEWALSRAGLRPEDAEDPLPASLEVVRNNSAEERHRFGPLAALIDAATAAGCPWMVDDERVTLGWGPGACSFEPARAPAPSTVDWDRFHAVPAVAITGTNGKTTSARLVAAMARAAGITGVGATSTDGIYVDGRLVDAGDWAGAGGTRELLRRPDVNFAVLETARGGLLRRGMGVFSCDAALITNIERDHLGDYGVFDLETMARAKGSITRAVRAAGRVVLCADSAPLVAWARGQAFSSAVVWYSVDAEHPVLAAHRAAGGETWGVESGRVVRRVGEASTPVVDVADIVIGLGGAARYNIANALGASALAHGVGIGDEAIAAALTTFGASPADNPARMQIWEVPRGDRGSTRATPLVIDFAHNVAGIEAVGQLLGARRRDAVICFGMAGDRGDAELEELGAALRRLEARAVVVREQPRYLRGRAMGEIPALLMRGGMPNHTDGDEDVAGSEVESLERAVAVAGDDGIVVLLVHVERDEVARWLASRGAVRRVGADAARTLTD